MPEMLVRLGFTAEVAASARAGASEQVEAASALLAGTSLVSDSGPLAGDGGGADKRFFDPDAPPPPVVSPRPGDAPTGAAAGSFFENLHATGSLTPKEKSSRAAAGGGTLNGGVGDSGTLEAEGEGETELQRHLFIGNHAQAVATCLSHDRLADALIVAHVSADPALWQSTLEKYMEVSPQPYLRVVEAQMREDYESLIKSRPVGRWAETAAILLTYVSPPDFQWLCKKLAKRLDESGMRHAAALCYICAADVDSAVTLWMRDAHDSALPVPRLQVRTRRVLCLLCLLRVVWISVHVLPLHRAVDRTGWLWVAGGAGARSADRHFHTFCLSVWAPVWHAVYLAVEREHGFEP